MEFTRTRLSIEVVEKVEEYLHMGYSYSQINKLTGVSKASISKIKNGTYKKVDPIYRIENDVKYIELLQAYKYYKNLHEKECEELKKYKIAYLQLKSAYKQLKEKTNEINKELSLYKSNDKLSRMDNF